jgi:hypothetical protein
MKKQNILQYCFRKNKCAAYLQFLSLFTIILSSCTNVALKNSQETQQILQHWKKAVIQLEGATDSKSIDDQKSLMHKLQDGKMSGNEYIEEISKGSRDIRFRGTAIYLENEGRSYLITARHVLFDEISAIRKFAEEQKQIHTWPINMRSDMLKRAYEDAQDEIFHIIFRVPTVDEMLQKKSFKLNEDLMNLGAGPKDTHHYTFTSPDIDLAIISLNEEYSNFAKELKSMGYEPIHLNDISNEPSSEGIDVFIVGFPSFSTFDLDLNPAIKNWSSGGTCIPNYAFGKVSMLHQNLSFFWSDISVYPGFSGSPVIENDKLVGVVSGQYRIPIERIIKTVGGERTEPDTSLLMRIPFGQIIKAKFLKPLLEEQIKKDKSHP